MNLLATTLPEPFVQTLRGLNIRELEAFLSIAETPRGLVAMSRALSLPTSELLAWVERLKHEHPEVDFTPAGGPLYPMGHAVPMQRVQRASES